MPNIKLTQPPSTLSLPSKSPQKSTVKSGVTTSRTMSTFGRIRADIMSGKLVPDSKLKVEDLKVTYGTGLSPLREALSLLTSERLVDRIDQRGFRVAPATRLEFVDLLATRCWAEERALRLSITRAGPDWEERLLLAHHRLERLEREASKREASAGEAALNPDWEANHRAFHAALLSECGSPVLLRFCEQLYDMNIRYRQIAGVTAYPRRNIKREHKAILDAVLARDADAGVRHLAEHYQRTGLYLEKAFG